MLSAGDNFRLIASGPNVYRTEAKPTATLGPWSLVVEKLISFDVASIGSVCAVLRLLVRSASALGKPTNPQIATAHHKVWGFAENTGG